jgi:hypothetical protein
LTGIGFGRDIEPGAVMDLLLDLARAHFFTTGGSRESIRHPGA